MDLENRADLENPAGADDGAGFGPAGDPPATLSPSRASDFMTCPLLYRFRVIDRIPEPPTPATARGTLVHAVLERLFDQPAAERTPATAAELVEPEWARLLVRLDVPYRVTDDVLGRPAMRDLRAGIAAGRFQVVDPRLALRASGGALIAVMHAVLLGELGERADCEHAEGVLRSFGLDPAEAAEIARRPMPDAIDPQEHAP